MKMMNGSSPYPPTTHIQKNGVMEGDQNCNSFMLWESFFPLPTKQLHVYAQLGTRQRSSHREFLVQFISEEGIG